MDIFGFFKLRLDFIKQLHERSCAPFALIKRHIEDKVPPYKPPYSEDGEPQFQAEWFEADESLQVLGYACISMLTTSLHLFLKTWEKELGEPDQPQYRNIFKKKGWISGYQQYFIDVLGIDYANSPVEMNRLEEIVRARNIIQHQDFIGSNTVSFTDDDLDTFQKPFLSSEIDRRMSRSPSSEERWFFPLSLHVPPDKFKIVLSDVAQFAAWLDEKIYDVMGRNQPNQRLESDA